ncbi:MAG: tyrosine-protein phosphatase [Propionibacteriaceae bacterium]|nr:tyrosine-protein phosphatase [Propionibacteriaceae bacterium]
MKRLLGSLAVVLATALGATVLVAPPAAATTYEVTGKILKTYLAAGGQAVFGDAVSARTVLRAGSRNVHHQHFENGVVLWSRTGHRTWLNDQLPSLKGVRNERIVADLATPIYRTGELCGASRFAKQLLASVLHDGVIIDLRSASAASDCKDPTMPGVTRYRYGMTGTTNLVTFVTKASDRASLGYALTRVAATDGPVLVHCTHGRDRTGMLNLILMFITGTDLATARAEYERSPGTPPGMFDALVDAIATNYPDGGSHGMTFAGVHRFVTEGLGLSEDTITTLKARYMVG